MACTAFTMRPWRPRNLSASVTSRKFGIAVGEESRMHFAINISSRFGLSAQAVMKAPAVERLIPA